MRKVTLVFSCLSIIAVIFISVFLLVNKDKEPTIIYRESVKSIVEIRASTGDIESFGTGVFISENNLITNFHVISFINQSITYEHEIIEVRFSNSNEYQNVEVIKFDSKLDLALLKIENNHGKKITISKKEVLIGESVFLLGNGNNLGISITAGLISMDEVIISNSGSQNKYIQVDATSTNGVSGGALLDNKGRLIGIVTLRLLNEEGLPIYGYVYAIPITEVLSFLDSNI